MSKLNAQNVKIVIDTGSDLSYVKASLVREKGWRCKKCAEENVIFGNSESEIVNSKVMGDVVIGDDFRKKSELYVLEKCPVDVILGLDLLTPYEIYRLLLLASNVRASSM